MSKPTRLTLEEVRARISGIYMMLEDGPRPTYEIHAAIQTLKEELQQFMDSGQNPLINHATYYCAQFANEAAPDGIKQGIWNWEANVKDWIAVTVPRHKNERHPVFEIVPSREGATTGRSGYRQFGQFGFELLTAVADGELRTNHVSGALVKRIRKLKRHGLFAVPALTIRAQQPSGGFSDIAWVSINRRSPERILMDIWDTLTEATGTQTADQAA